MAKKKPAKRRKPQASTPPMAPPVLEPAAAAPSGMPPPDAGGPAPSPQAQPSSPHSVAELPESDPMRKPFTPEVMDRTVIAIPLLNKLKAEAERRKHDPSLAEEVYDIIIDVNLEYCKGRQEARKRVSDMVKAVCAELKLPKDEQGINETKSQFSQQYLFGRLCGRAIRELVIRDDRLPPEGCEGKPLHTQRGLYRIWNDFEVQGLTVKSI